MALEAVRGSGWARAARPRRGGGQGPWGDRGDRASGRSPLSRAVQGETGRSQHGVEGAAWRWPAPRTPGRAPGPGAIARGLDVGFRQPLEKRAPRGRRGSGAEGSLGFCFSERVDGAACGTLVTDPGAGSLCRPRAEGGIATALRCRGSSVTCDPRGPCRASRASVQGRDGRSTGRRVWLGEESSCRATSPASGALGLRGPRG